MDPQNPEQDEEKSQMPREDKETDGLALGSEIRTGAVAGRLRWIVVLCLAMAAGSVGMTGSAVAAGSHARIASAHLSKKRFTAAQARKVELVYRFSAESRDFSYRLMRKARERAGAHGSWKLVKHVARKGHFKGTHKLSVKRLFAGEKVTVGAYRVKLSADTGAKTISFRVVKKRSGSGSGGGSSGATAISAGEEQACALPQGGAVDCWGGNTSGELGTGNRDQSDTPVPVSGISDATQVAAGDYYTCALLKGGTVDCWGGNSSGELGIGSSTGPDECLGVPCSLKPVTVKGISDATQIAVDGESEGGDHACALLSSGAIKCWGYNSQGELGDGTTANSDTPVPVSGISDATQVSAGGESTCALLTGGTVDCWGANYDGELGNGPAGDTGGIMNSDTPVPVSGISDATQVSAGSESTCALLVGGTIDCWGLNYGGQLGNGANVYESTFVQSGTPVPVSGISDATQVAAGNDFTCALLTGGVADCWGYNPEGQLGTRTAIVETPVRVSGISGATEITAGSDFNCALLKDGAVRCWGANHSGQLGNGTATAKNSLVPVQVKGIG